MLNGPFIEKNRQLRYALLAVPAAVVCYALVIIVLSYTPHTEGAFAHVLKDMTQLSLVVPNIVTLYVVFISIFCAQITTPFSKAFAWRSCPMLTCFGWILIMAALTGIDIGLRQYFGFHLEMPWYRFLAQHQGSWFWYGLLLLLVPCLEECLFRGFIYYGISHSVFGHSGAIALTAYLWATPAGYHHPYWFLVNLLYGFALGCARYHSHSLMPPIAMHILSGLLLFISSSALSIGW